MSQPEVLKPLKTWSHLAGSPAQAERVRDRLDQSALHDRQSGRAVRARSELPDRACGSRTTATPRRSSMPTGTPSAIRTRWSTAPTTCCRTARRPMSSACSTSSPRAGTTPCWSTPGRGSLARLYTPARYLFHTLQMGSAYLTARSRRLRRSRTAPTYQTADSLRWLTHTAYRTKELSQDLRRRRLRHATSVQAGRTIRPGRASASWSRRRWWPRTGRNASSR